LAELAFPWIGDRKFGPRGFLRGLYFPLIFGVCGVIYPGGYSQKRGASKAFGSLTPQGVPGAKAFKPVFFICPGGSPEF